MPRQAEPGIANEVVGTVAAALMQLGYAPAAALNKSEQAVVPGSSADALFDDAARTLHNEALGIDVGKRLPFGSLGILDYALCSAGTVREGLERLVRYYGIVTQRVGLEIQDDGTHARLLFKRDPKLNHSRHWLEFSFSAIAERLRQTAGPKLSLEAVKFSHPPPADRKVHDAFFGVRVEFSAGEDVMGFASAAFDLPLLTAASALATVLEGRMKELEPERALSDPYVGKVRKAVVELLDKEDSRLESVVSRLGVARRSLQRELQQRGTSHKEILDDVRRERALHLLEVPGLTVTEVAYRLGFSEPSAFFRAFRRWTGKSPKAAVAQR